MLGQNRFDNSLLLDTTIRSTWVIVVGFEIIYVETKYIFIFDGIGYGIGMQLLFKTSSVVL